MPIPTTTIVRPSAIRRFRVMNWRLIIARCRAAADLTAAQNWRRTLLTILRAHYRSAAVPPKCPGRPRTDEVSKEQRQAGKQQGARLASSNARAGADGRDEDLTGL